MTLAACEPGHFCPDHPVDPGLMVLIAAAILGITLFAIAAVLLVVTIATAARYIHRRITRARPPAPEAPEPEDAPPAYLDVMAAAVEDWWLTTDPANGRATGPDIAAHVEMYLRSSGYHITPDT